MNDADRQRQPEMSALARAGQRAVDGVPPRQGPTRRADDVNVDSRGVIDPEGGKKKPGGQKKDNEEDPINPPPDRSNLSNLGRLSLEAPPLSGRSTGSAATAPLPARPSPVDVDLHTIGWTREAFQRVDDPDTLNVQALERPTPEPTDAIDLARLAAKIRTSEDALSEVLAAPYASAAPSALDFRSGDHGMSDDESRPGASIMQDTVTKACAACGEPKDRSCFNPADWNRSRGRCDVCRETNKWPERTMPSRRLGAASSIDDDRPQDVVPVASLQTWTVSGSSSSPATLKALDSAPDMSSADVARHVEALLEGCSLDVVATPPKLKMADVSVGDVLACRAALRWANNGSDILAKVTALRKGKQRNRIGLRDSQNTSFLAPPGCCMKASPAEVARFPDEPSADYDLLLASPQTQTPSLPSRDVLTDLARCVQTLVARSGYTPRQNDMKILARSADEQPELVLGTAVLLFDKVLCRLADDRERTIGRSSLRAVSAVADDPHLVLAVLRAAKALMTDFLALSVEKQQPGKAASRREEDRRSKAAAFEDLEERSAAIAAEPQVDMGRYAYVAALGGTTPRAASRQQFSRTRPSTIIDMGSKALTEKGAMLDRALGGKEGVEDLYEVVRAFMDEESVDDFIKAGKLNSVYDSCSTDHAFACRLGTESSDQAYHDLNTYARALGSFYDRASKTFIIEPKSDDEEALAWARIAERGKILVDKGLITWNEEKESFFFEGEFWRRYEAECVARADRFQALSDASTDRGTQSSQAPGYASMAEQWRSSTRYRIDGAGVIVALEILTLYHGGELPAAVYCKYGVGAVAGATDGAEYRAQILAIREAFKSKRNEELHKHKAPSAASPPKPVQIQARSPYADQASVDAGYTRVHKIGVIPPSVFAGKAAARRLLDGEGRHAVGSAEARLLAFFRDAESRVPGPRHGRLAASNIEGFLSLASGTSVVFLACDLRYKFGDDDWIHTAAAWPSSDEA